MLCFVSHGFAALRSVSLTVYHGESLEAREHFLQVFSYCGFAMSGCVKINIFFLKITKFLMETSLPTPICQGLC